MLGHSDEMVVTALFLLLPALVSSSLWHTEDMEEAIVDDRLIDLGFLLKKRLGSPVITVVTIDHQLSALKYLHQKLGALQLSEFGRLSSKLTLCVIQSQEDILKATSEAFWDPEFYYVIYFLDSKLDSRRLFLYLWNSFHVYRVIVASRSDNAVETFDPVLKTIQNNSITTLPNSSLLTTKLPDWKQIYFYTVYAGRYVDKRFKNSRTFLVDRLTLAAITGRLNLRSKITNTTDDSVKFGFRSDNGTFFGTFKDLSTRQANMSANVHFLKYNNILNSLTYSAYARADKICIAVPKTKQIPRFIESFESFNITVWLFIALMYTITALTLKYLRHSFATVNKKLLSDTSLPLIMFGICLGQPVDYRPKLHSEKLLFTAVLLVSFVVGSFIQSTLKAVVTTPPNFYSFPNSREEFNQHKIEIWTSSQDLIDSYQEVGYIGVRFHLKTAAEQRRDSPKYDIATLEKVAAVLDPMTLEFIKGSMQITNVCPVLHNVAYVFPRGSPFKEPVDWIINSLVESGVMLKWDKYVYEHPKRTIQFAKKHREVTELKPLSMEDMVVLFYFNMWGFVAALLAFIAEIVMHRVKGKNQQQASSPAKNY